MHRAKVGHRHIMTLTIPPTLSNEVTDNYNLQSTGLVPYKISSILNSSIFYMFLKRVLLALVPELDKMYNSGNSVVDFSKMVYEGPANSFVTGFGLFQCYVLSNIFLLQTFKAFPIYWNTFL